MHSVDILEEALSVALNSGFDVRQEWLNEKGGGVCRIGKKRVLFVDLSLTAAEQLDQVVSSLKGFDNLIIESHCSRELRGLLAS